MKVLSIQMALFTGDLISRPDLMMSSINDAMGNIFDAMPNIMNLPMNAPPEIPIAQTKSSNEKYALNVSRNRIDLLISPQYETQDGPLELVRSFKSSIDKYYKSVLNLTDLVRAGMVITLFEEEENNVKRIYDKYFCMHYSLDCTEAEFKINKQKMIRGMVFNNIQFVQAGVMHMENRVQKGVLIQFDVNNALENGKTISNEIITSIVTQSIDKIKPGKLKEII